MIDLGTNTLAFIFALGVIIFVHEAGHLAVAKVFGMRVLTFSLGFGRRIWGFERGGTEYRVSLIPLGGYVRLGGEDPGEVGDDPDEFLNKPRWQRVLVYVAGPAANVLLSVLLIWGALFVGVEVTAIQDAPPVVGFVEEGSPAAEAGIAQGDRIATLTGEEVERWSDVLFTVTTSPGRPLEVVLERDGERVETTLVPELLEREQIGDAGFFPQLLPRVSQVFSGTPAERAGFRPGDEIRSVDGRPIGGSGPFVDYIEEHPGEEVRIEVARDGERVELVVVPEAAEEAGGVGRIGVGLSLLRRYGAGEALVESVRYNWEIGRNTLDVLGKIVTGRLAAKGALSGPLEIARVSGEAARRSFTDLIFLMGLISISIAILNLLPIPILDGGQITLLAIESVLRRDLSMRLKERVNQIGFVLIVMLMLTVIYFDLVKNLPFGLLPSS